MRRLMLLLHFGTMLKRLQAPDLRRRSRSLPSSAFNKRRYATTSSASIDLGKKRAKIRASEPSSYSKL